MVFDFLYIWNLLDDAEFGGSGYVGVLEGGGWGFGVGGGWWVVWLD